MYYDVVEERGESNSRVNGVVERTNYFPYAFCTKLASLICHLIIGYTRARQLEGRIFMREIFKVRCTRAISRVTCKLFIPNSIFIRALAC